MLVGRYPALLDANVLHPAFVRGALLWFAEQRLFQPHWTAEILTEWRRSVLRRFKDLDEGRLLAKQAEMNEFFPDAEITGYERFTPCVELPDGGDNHVLAAAVVGRCAGIVTCNTKHFPAEVTKPLGRRTPNFVVVRGPIPNELSNGNLYVNPQGNRAHHLCACGCGERVLTPLNEVEWTLSGPDESPSLHPSVGNWNLPCLSHYVVRHGQVVWARSFTPAEIAACRSRDLKPYLGVSWRERAIGWLRRFLEFVRGPFDK